MNTLTTIGRAMKAAALAAALEINPRATRSFLLRRVYRRVNRRWNRIEAAQRRLETARA